MADAYDLIKGSVGGGGLSTEDKLIYLMSLVTSSPNIYMNTTTVPTTGTFWNFMASYVTMSANTWTDVCNVSGEGAFWGFVGGEPNLQVNSDVRITLDGETREYTIWGNNRLLLGSLSAPIVGNSDPEMDKVLTVPIASSQSFGTADRSIGSARVISTNNPLVLFKENLRIEHRVNGALGSGTYDERAGAIYRVN